jgi:hypothetical protein
MPTSKRSGRSSAKHPHDLQLPGWPHWRQAAGFASICGNAASGQHRAIPTEHNGLLTSIVFSPTGYLATLGRHTDGAIRILDATDFSAVRRYQAHDLCGAVIDSAQTGK